MAAQRFCFDNNLEFKLINPISRRIELLLESDDLDDCEMKHISLDECETGTQNVTIKKREGGLNPGVLMYERNRRLTELSKKKNKILQ